LSDKSLRNLYSSKPEIQRMIGEEFEKRGYRLLASTNKEKQLEVNLKNRRIKLAQEISSFIENDNQIWTYKRLKESHKKIIYRVNLLGGISKILPYLSLEALIRFKFSFKNLQKIQQTFIIQKIQQYYVDQESRYQYISSQIDSLIHTFWDVNYLKKEIPGLSMLIIEFTRLDKLVPYLSERTFSLLRSEKREVRHAIIRRGFEQEDLQVGTDVIIRADAELDRIWLGEEINAWFKNKQLKSWNLDKLKEDNLSLFDRLVKLGGMRRISKYLNLDVLELFHSIDKELQQIVEKQIRLIRERIIPRPVTYADCEHIPMYDCPFLTCEHNLGIDLKSGGRVINKTGHPYCLLKLTEKGGLTLQEIGDIFGLTRERVRKIEEITLIKLRKSGMNIDLLKRLREFHDL